MAKAASFKFSALGPCKNTKPNVLKMSSELLAKESLNPQKIRFLLIIVYGLEEKFARDEEDIGLCFCNVFLLKAESRLSGRRM